MKKEDEIELLDFFEEEKKEIEANKNDKDIKHIDGEKTQILRSLNADINKYLSMKDKETNENSKVVIEESNETVEEEKKSLPVKILKRSVSTVITLSVIIGAVFIFLLAYGIKPYIVLSGSMEPYIHTGSVNFVNTNVKYSDIKTNDVISFRIDTGNVVTHRAKSITNEGIETKGDANTVSDGITTTNKNYIGKSLFSIPKIGYAVKSLRTKKGAIVLGTVVIMILLLAFFLEDDSKSKNKKSKNGKK